MNGEEVIGLYESIAQLTDQMLAAARVGNWEQLSALESECEGYIKTLKQNESEVTLTEDKRTRKIDIIKKILEDDRDIRNLTEPGLKRLSALIHNNSNERKLAQTYGANQGG
ncbi:flagellar protein FliT [Herbaspirillum lusitanum]|jgi:flagellar protein FliT|uniref:Flagellar protein FliT n=1 Tax=Herbaspirillum lusitanum TaxID=213312 RepID=A0ABW9A5V8_9BURK